MVVYKGTQRLFDKIFEEDPYKLLEKCLAIMNENVDYGCCGECV